VTPIVDSYVGPLGTGCNRRVLRGGGVRGPNYPEYFTDGALITIANDPLSLAATPATA
jgi:hypothetical protein